MLRKVFAKTFSENLFNLENALQISKD